MEVNEERNNIKKEDIRIKVVNGREWKNMQLCISAYMYSRRGRKKGITEGKRMEEYSLSSKWKIMEEMNN